MDFSLFEKMEAAELRSYIRFLLWHYRVVDAFWFIKVGERFDQQTAEQINEEVWEKVAGMAAKDLRARFDIQATGLAGFVKALKYFPWCILVGYQIEQTEERVTLTVPACPTQVARLDRGLGEYNCKEMHRREFVSFARVLDDRIQVACDFAPPDPHPDDLFCRWHFSLAPDPPGLPDQKE